MPSFYRKLSLVLFGGLVEKNIASFKPLELHIRNANMKILLKTWISMLFMSTFISFFVSFILIYVLLSYIVQVEFYIYIFCIIFFPVFVASLVFIFFYLYPVEKERSRQRSIENNMPFAITHMAAIASSGIPTEFMFELLTGFKEYGEISQDSKLIMRNIKTFGMSSIDALKDIADRTPSQSFRELLLGIVSTTESGGDMVEYLHEMSERALFDYRIKRERYMKTLSTYADIYTALLVAAPLMMLSMLATMSIIGGSVMGLTIDEMIMLITWVMLPFLNVAFIVFIHITYPGV
jgi:flagellar protein FlaJ